MSEMEKQTGKEDQIVENDRKAEETVVPAEEPDLAGRWVLRGKRFLAFFMRPLGRCGALFLAPLWKPFQKGADKITKRDWILFLVMILSIVLVAAAPVVLVKVRSTHKEQERLYCLFVGEKMYWENAKFETTQENQVTVKDADGREMNANGWPFYFENEDAMFWPFYGMWYSVEENLGKRVERFSKIDYEHGTGCSIQLPDGGGKQLTGFLYDNQDTYVFLENVILTYNGQSRNLSPLSFVRAYGSNTMELYYYGQEKGEIIQLESDPEIRFSNGATIDLKADMMRYPNGTPRLLFLLMEYIDPLSSE